MQTGNQDLWQELKDALALPQFADLKRLCQLFDWAIAQLPENQQLVAAGKAIEQIATVYSLKADWLMKTWETAHEASEPYFPVLTSEAIDGWIRQSMSIDMDIFVEQPISKRSRKHKPQPTDSIAAVVDQVSLAEMLDRMEAELNPEQVVRQLAGEENPVQWSAKIAQWLQENGSGQPVYLLHLYSELGLPFVDLWLGLILGDFELNQMGDFYSLDVWIKYEPEKRPLRLDSFSQS